MMRSMPCTVAVVVVEAAGGGAHPEGDDPLGIGHLLPDAAQDRRLLLADGADDPQQIGLTRREARELRAEAGDVVARPGHRHELHAAAGGDERVLEQGELAPPVHAVLDHVTEPVLGVSLAGDHDLRLDEFLLTHGVPPLPRGADRPGRSAWGPTPGCSRRQPALKKPVLTIRKWNRTGTVSQPMP